MELTNGYYLTKAGKIEYLAVNTFDQRRTLIQPAADSILSMHGHFADYLTYATLIYPIDSRNDDTFKDHYPEFFI